MQPNFSRGDDPERKLAKLEALLAQGSEDVARSASLIASLLSIPSAGRYPPLNMSPQLQRERTLVELVDQLAGLSAHRPVLLVWEDAQWADPTSLELLGLAIDRLQSLPVLALVTFRLDFTPPWPSQTHVTSLTLNRLGRPRCGRLVAGLTGGKPLPEEVPDQVLAKTDGVPAVRRGADQDGARIRACCVTPATTGSCRDRCRRLRSPRRSTTR